ncbi:MAG: MFS transporter [Gammaproteobacteria bacterium BRH_c0]|nr:MAG: MFS transporter [Gammaproteobacteria bacterium BRH_c0]
MTQPSENQASDNAEIRAKEPHKAENLLVNLLFNIVLPTLILTKLSGDEFLGTTYAIVVALAFPICYGLKDMLTRGKVNLFSVLGVFSVGMTGGISLLGLDPRYLAIKEAAVPATFGLATLISIKTPYPLVKTFIYNDTILDIPAIDTALARNGTRQAFERHLSTASLMVAGSFFLSSVLNYLLAIIIVTSQPGTLEYNEQLGKMTALSFPVIALPAMVVMMAAMFYLFRGITKLTGLDLEHIVKHRHKEK